MVKRLIRWDLFAERRWLYLCQKSAGHCAGALNLLRSVSAGWEHPYSRGPRCSPGGMLGMCQGSTDSARSLLTL